MSAADIARALETPGARAERGAAVALCMAGAASLCAMVMAGRCSLGASAVATVAMCSRSFDAADYSKGAPLITGGPSQAHHRRRT